MLTRNVVQKAPFGCSDFDVSILPPNRDLGPGGPQSDRCDLVRLIRQRGNVSAIFSAPDAQLAVSLTDKEFAA